MFLSALAAALLFMAGFWLLVHHLTSYGETLFIGESILLGFAASAFLACQGRARLSVQFGTAVLAAILGVFGLLVTGFEGAICIAMCVPLAAPLIFLGAFIGHLVFHRGRGWHWPGSTVLVAAALLGAIGVKEAGVERVPEVHVAEDSVIVHATADETWRAIVNLSDVAPSHDVLFRAGIACPQRTRIVHAGAGGERVCTLSTGILMERIDVWQPRERLAWRAVSTPPPMRELNPIRDADPPHLHGFYRNVRGEFAIESLGPRLTRLTRRTWYSHDLYPSFYWTMWCDMGASKIQRFVLEEVRRALETRRA